MDSESPFQPEAEGSLQQESASGEDLAHTLLREAQEEIGALRSELYSTRRREWEVREALTQATHERDDAQQSFAESQQQVAALQVTSARASQLKEQLHELERNHSVLDLEVQELRQKLDESQHALTSEQTSRRKAEELRARSEGERSRLLRQRDEAQSQLRIAMRRAEEAEEEQCRAEEEAAQARSELASYVRPPEQPEGLSDDSDKTQRQHLQAALESERSRVAFLTAALDKAKAESAILRAAQTESSAVQEAGPQIFSGPTIHLEEELQRREAELEQLRLELQLREAEIARQESAAKESLAKAMEASAAMQAQGQAAAAMPSVAANGVRPTDAEAVGGDLPSDTELDDLRARAKEMESLIHRLKLTREKLLLEMDEQSITVERLYAENEALSDALFQQRHVSSKWELQAQEGLARSEQLKNMLEESATWGLNNLTSTDANSPEYQIEKLEAELVVERAKCADLDLQVRALSAEITKATQHTGELSRSVLPVLTAIEGRMMQLTMASAVQ